MESKNYLLICNKIDSLSMKEMKQLEMKNFSSTVDELANQIALDLEIDKNNFNLVCFGKILDYSKTLDFYGIENGTILYLLKKKNTPSPKLILTDTSSASLFIPKETASEPLNLSTENQGQCIALKSALLSSSFKQVIENLCDFDNRENLMNVNNELRNDPSLFGVLSDSELLHAYINKSNIKNVLKHYPNFLEVATYISASFHEESNSSNIMDSILFPGSSLNFSIDAISEDEEMEESETSSISSTNTNGSMRRGLSDPSSFSSMLMRAYNSRNQQQSSNTITPDMLREAIATTNALLEGDSTSSSEPNSPDNQEATDTSSNPSAPPPVENRSPAQILIGWAPQLQQMRELGINDDIVAIQALEAANGDVQAALNIIFSDMN